MLTVGGGDVAVFGLYLVADFVVRITRMYRAFSFLIALSCSGGAMAACHYSERFVPADDGCVSAQADVQDRLGEPERVDVFRGDGWVATDWWYDQRALLVIFRESENKPGCTIVSSSDDGPKPLPANLGNA